MFTIRQPIPLAFTLAALGCAEPSFEDLTSNQIRLQFTEGQTFFVESQRRMAHVKTPNTPAPLSKGMGSMAFEANWTTPAVWTYQVVETGLVPDSSDPLFEYAQGLEGSVESLSVVRAYLDPTVNADVDLLDSNPVVYMVFREDRDRLAAVISFTDVDGERVERAVATHQLGTAWSGLSQSMLSDAPTYLAPFTSSFVDADDVILENGHTYSSHLLDASTVEVSYDDEFGGGAVLSTYERDLPWPTHTSTANLEARLLTDGEMDALRRARQSGGQSAPPPEDFDFRAALAARFDLDATLTLDEDLLTGQGWAAEAYEEVKPWAGNWWPLSTAELVFGYEDRITGETRPTFSERIKAQIEPLASRKDEIQAELRELADDAPERQALFDEYNEKHNALVEALVSFYDGIRDDLDGGRIVIENGTITHTDDGWSYAIDELSPFDKFGLAEHLRDANINNPFYLSAWELLNQYNPVGGSWWGHCNGWAAAAIATHEPTEPFTHTFDGTDITFSVADQKGLLTASFYSTSTNFFGARYDGKEGQDIADLHPDAFHKIIDYYLRQQRIPFVFDTTAAEAVWNYPAYGADLAITEVTGEASSQLNVNTASAEELDGLYGIGPTLARRIIAWRTWLGPFQSVDDLTYIRGIGPATLDGIRDQVRVTPVERSFDVTATVTLQSDGVPTTFNSLTDADPSFDKVWSYTLVTDADGQVLRGTWADDNEHPDFAWVPYFNPRTRSQAGSENPFLHYQAIIDVFGEDIERQ